MDNTMNQQPQATAQQNAATNSCTSCQNQQTQASMALQQNAGTANTGNTAPQAIVGIFRDLSAAEQCVTQLRNSGFTTEEINIISKDTSKEAAAGGNDSIMDGTMTGGAIGGLGGLLLSAGALTIPGIGPIIAAGPLAATIAGAVGGGITGGLVDWGIPAAKSEEYTNEVSSGNTLAVLKSTQNKVAQAIQILTANGAVNVETHAAS